jgi:hypothetical protein
MSRFRWQPWATGIAAAGAGYLSVGWPGLALGLAGALLAVLPFPLRIGAVLALAALPLPPLGSPTAWLALALLAVAAAAIVLDVLPPSREVGAAVGLFALLVTAAAVAIPNAGAFFQADAGLATFFVAGAAVVSVGAAVALVPKTGSLEERT